MIHQEILTANLLIIANHIHKETRYFRIRIDKKENQQEMIQKASWFWRFPPFLFYSPVSFDAQLEHLIHQNVKTASQLGREAFIDPVTAESTPLFLAAQKYNQTVATAQHHPLQFAFVLANRFQLPLIQNPLVPEINPSRIISVKALPVSTDLQKDKPLAIQQKRGFSSFLIRRYPGDPVSQGNIGRHIFVSTQKERLLSGIGKAIEGMAFLMGLKVSTFFSYHYRKNQETDLKIYASPASPLALEKELTSYWLGHATVLLSLPLRSKQGNSATFHLITDPIEGDINALLYPRQTKFPCPLDQLPVSQIYLLSHNHLDHCDKRSIQKIFAQQPLFIVPQGERDRYSKLGKELGFSQPQIIEMDWWEKKEITIEKNGELFQLQISATPARHWSGQGPWGGHESSFVGYIIQGFEKGDIYFAGDTARLNEEHRKKLKNHFNIRWSFQPGGPDEGREQMESSHQASADGLWMHVQLMLEKLYETKECKKDFLKRAREFKTIYMHTMTFKLGNNHLSETKESVEKVLNALAGHACALKSYEQQVYNELCQWVSQIKFPEGQSLSHQELGQLLNETVILPKIGSCLGLETPKTKQLGKVYL